jgi:hypothetical protein
VASRKRRDPFCSSALPEIVRHRPLRDRAVVSERLDKASKRMTAAYHRHLKASIFIFILGVLSAGSVVAQDWVASPSPASETVQAAFNFDYRNDQMVERAIDEHTVDRLGLFDRSNDGGSGRYSVSLELENEESDWSFEVTVTIEF